MVKREITFETNLTFPQTIVAIEKTMSLEDRVFPERIMTGRIYGTKLDATINPPSGIVDPFRTNVEGNIEAIASGTKIDFRVSFGLVNILCLLIWYIPMIFVLQYERNQNVNSVLLIFGACSLFSVISFILLTVKMNWDRRRLENWLRNSLNGIVN